MSSYECTGSEKIGFEANCRLQMPQPYQKLLGSTPRLPSARSNDRQAALLMPPSTVPNHPQLEAPGPLPWAPGPQQRSLAAAVGHQKDPRSHELGGGQSNFSAHDFRSDQFHEAMAAKVHPHPSHHHGQLVHVKAVRQRQQFPEQLQHCCGDPLRLLPEATLEAGHG